MEALFQLTPLSRNAPPFYGTQRFITGAHPEPDAPDPYPTPTS